MVLAALSGRAAARRPRGPCTWGDRLVERSSADATADLLAHHVVSVDLSVMVVADGGLVRSLA